MTTSIQSQPSCIEDLKVIRDRYHNGSWTAMIRHYKIQTSQKNIPPQLKEQMTSDIKAIKSHIGQNPEGGWKTYENVKFRLPANVCASQLEETLKTHEDSLPQLASLCIREILFMVNEERKRKKNE